MNKPMELIGHVAALLGILLCAAAGIARITGHFYVLNFEAMTLFNVGVGLLVFACLAKLYQIASLLGATRGDG